MKFFRILSDTIFKFEKVLANIMLSILLISLFLGVLFRYVFNSPLAWTGEITLFSLVWVSFIGGSMSIKSQQAVAVTILTDKLKGKARSLIVTLGLFICVVFTIVLCYYSFQWITNPNILLQKSDSIQFPMFIPYSSVVVGILFMTIHSIHLFLEYIQHSRGKVT